MRLTAIDISNFKGLKSGRFDPTQFSCLVGENNAGKSSVLQAIVYALNRPAQMPLSLYHDPATPVTFTLQFSEISEGDLARLAMEHRAKIAPLITDGIFRYVVRYDTSGRAELKVIKRTPRDPRYADDRINEVFRNKRGAAVREALVIEYPEFANDAPGDIATIGAAKEFLQNALTNLPPDQLEDAEAPLPSGIGPSITNLLPEPIYIPAVKNLADDLKTTQSTSFGRLLGLLLDDMMPDLARVDEALTGLNAMLNKVVVDGVENDQRHDKVRELEDLVEKLLSENFPQVKIQLHIPPPELRAVLNAAQIYVDDGSHDLIENKGDGIKRSLTFALLQAYTHQLAAKAAMLGGGDSVRPLLFLFEEPELYLHPKSQKVLFNTLGKISETHQVVVTTHSPLFFAPGVTAGFVRVAKRQAEPKPVGILYPVNFELDEVRAETFRLTKFENANAGFFSKRVVLFEGESDDAYLRHVAKLLNPKWDFEQCNISLVKVSGKGNFARYRYFFSAFGIDIKIVADLDALFHGFEHLGANADIARLRSETIQALDRHIQTLANVPEPTARQIKNQVKRDSWRIRYENARNALRQAQAAQAITLDTIDTIDQLFMWETEVRRLSVCRENVEARRTITPLLDALRAQGICILAKGAIEDYYPDGVTPTITKPDRALKAAHALQTKEQCEALSEAIMEGRPSELVEIFTILFAEA